MIIITCHSIAIWQAIISKESFIIIACEFIINIVCLEKSKKILPVKDWAISSGLKCLEHTKVESVIWKKMHLSRKNPAKNKQCHGTNHNVVHLLFIFYQPINISSHHTGLLQMLHVVYMYYDMNLSTFSHNSWTFTYTWFAVFNAIIKWN